MALAVVSLGGALLVLDRYDLATQFEDDAFYYFQIAKNVAHGRGFTFDGLHATNGFHPLWLVALFPIFGSIDGLDAAVRVAGLLEAALLGLAGATVYHALRERIGRPGARLAALATFALPGTRHMTRSGLECALTLCLLAGVWRTWLELDRTRRRSWLKLGLLCGLLALARLETFCALPALLWGERRWLRSDPRAALVLVLAATAPVGGYLAWSELSFGLWLPVSGAVKHFWAAFDGYALPLGLRLPRQAPEVMGAVVTACGAAWFGARALPALHARAGAIGWGFLCFVACTAITAETLSLGYVSPWYLGPAILCGAVGVGIASAGFARAANAAAAIIGLVAIARVPYTVMAVRTHLFQAHLRGVAADWVRHHTPSDARIGTWNGGMLGYYSGRHVVMLDGLANSVDFYRRAFLQSDLPGYLEEQHLTLLVTAGHELGPLLCVEHAKPLRAIEDMYVMTGSASDRSDIGPADSMMVWKRR